MQPSLLSNLISKHVRIYLCWRSQSWKVLWRPTKPSRTNSPRDVLFIIGDWHAKVGKSRNICCDRQVWPWSTKWSRTEAKSKFCQENVLVITTTLFQQHKRQLYTWTSPNSQYRNKIDYILCSWRWGSSIQSAKTRLGTDCGSDHELIAKFRLQLKKAGKTTRPFRYGLDQIPYDFAVEVTDSRD